MTFDISITAKVLLALSIVVALGGYSDLAHRWLNLQPTQVFFN